jgi:hypothetical protein
MFTNQFRKNLALLSPDAFRGQTRNSGHDMAEAGQEPAWLSCDLKADLAKRRTGFLIAGGMFPT